MWRILSTLRWIQFEITSLVKYCINWRRFCRKDRQWVISLLLYWGLLLVLLYAGLLITCKLRTPPVFKPNGFVKAVHLYMRGA